MNSGENSTFQSSSFNRTGSFGKGTRLGVAFDPSLGPAPEDASNKVYNQGHISKDNPYRVSILFQLVRFPTPFRKDMKALKAKRKKGKYKPEATPSTTIFRKGSASSRDDLTQLSVNPSETSHSDEVKRSRENFGGDVSGCDFLTWWALLYHWMGVAFTEWVWLTGGRGL